MKPKISASSVCQFNLEEMPSWDLIVILNLFTRWFSNMPTSFCTLASWLRFASYNPSSYTEHNDLIFSYCNNCFSLALLMCFSPSCLPHCLSTLPIPEAQATGSWQYNCRAFANHFDVLYFSPKLNVLASGFCPVWLGKKEVIELPSLAPSQNKSLWSLFIPPFHKF